MLESGRRRRDDDGRRGHRRLTRWRSERGTRGGARRRPAPAEGARRQIKEAAMRPTFQGSIVALVTPFRNGRVDEAKLAELVDFHVANGTDGIVPCGTTGESPTLSHAEHKRVVEVVIRAAAGRIAVVAGTGSNSTAEAIDMTVHAARAGAGGARQEKTVELHL